MHVRLCVALFLHNFAMPHSVCLRGDGVLAWLQQRVALVLQSHQGDVSGSSCVVHVDLYSSAPMALACGAEVAVGQVLAKVQAETGVAVSSLRLVAYGMCAAGCAGTLMTRFHRKTASMVAGGGCNRGTAACRAAAPAAGTGVGGHGPCSGASVAACRHCWRMCGCRWWGPFLHLQHGAWLRYDMLFIHLVTHSRCLPASRKSPMLCGSGRRSGACSASRRCCTFRFLVMCHV